MAGLDLNYFVCTLGQAAEAQLCQNKPYQTINGFLDHQAQIIPNQPAVAFPSPSLSGNPEQVWKYQIFTFRELRRETLRSGSLLAELVPSDALKGKTVALLCPSSIEFLLAWLGLIRQGCSVLLLAPQCQSAAIAHLCKSCRVTALFHDKTYAALAEDATRNCNSENLKRISLPDFHVDAQAAHERDKKSLQNDPDDVDEQDIAYLHHTSGTSTGVPKPIPQSHRAAVGVLPVFANSCEKASFTTTPLYHGGVADCFRAWTSGALIWLFPGKHVPITASNVLRCLAAAQKCREVEKAPPVMYFSSVPYVLQMLASENEGLQCLLHMDIVGVGGAALTQDVGDDLVAKGVNLASRFGSAECGFLMSSHRKYELDKAWSYLRSHNSSLLEFRRDRDDGLEELVVHREWPHMTKRNTQDGGYATSDLFQAHGSIPNAWKYHSRADSQLTLITGKKFDPAPFEDAIAASPLLSGVFVFGNGQQYPGALLLRSSVAAAFSEQDLLCDLWPLVEKLNAEGQDHARISRSMLLVMPHGAPNLPKSSKGTVIRGEAEKIFAPAIRQAYEGLFVTTDEQEHTEGIQVPPDHEVATAVLKIIKQVIAKPDPIPADADLFTYGVDSVACMQIRGLLQNGIIGKQSRSLPLNVVYDNGNITRLADFLVKFRKGQAIDTEDEIKLMWELVDEYSNVESIHSIKEFSDESGSNAASGADTLKETIILTGGTGSLGAHILSQLLKLPTTTRIVCLVRGSSPEASQARITKALSQRRLDHGVQALITSRKLQCIPCNLSNPDLGLGSSIYKDLAINTTLIIHAAWSVNFNTRLRSFVRDHIGGFKHLLSFAASSHKNPQLLFCSSIASVSSFTSTRMVSESISVNPHSANPLGYSRSKWVAEQICYRVACKYDSQRSDKYNWRDRIKVLRIGQLCGDTVHGIWNMNEAWPLMLSASRTDVTGGLPDLGDEPLGWLPFDRAAEAILRISGLSSDPICISNPRTMSPERKLRRVDEGAADAEDIRVYHVLNPDSTTTWRDLITWVKDRDPGLEVFEKKEWLRRLEEVEEHPAKKLIGLWKEGFGAVEEAEGEAGTDDGRNEDHTEKNKNGDRLRFDITKTKSALGGESLGLRIDEPVTRELFEKLYGWIMGESVQ